MKITLNLELDLTLNGESPDTIARYLRTYVDYGMENGLVTQATEAEIDNYTVRIGRVIYE